MTASPTPEPPREPARPGNGPGGDLDDAVARCIAELDAAALLHRDTLASVSMERTGLANQLEKTEHELTSVPHGSEHGRRLATTVESVRVRLQAADSVAEVATRALDSAEHAREVLLAASVPRLDPAEREVDQPTQRLVFQVIEDERMRIARDMHDGPAQLLANLVLKAEIVERLLDHDMALVRSELVEFKAIVRVALEETRQLIFDLRPMTLDDLGLVPTLRTFLSDFEERWHIPCRMTSVGAERRLERDREAALFRIVQEACSNARRHAMATAIDVSVSMSPKRIIVTVEDDGRGFDVAAAESAARRTNHLGITSMRERAALTSATLELTSTPGQGTQVRVSING